MRKIVEFIKSKVVFSEDRVDVLDGLSDAESKRLFEEAEKLLNNEAFKKLSEFIVEQAGNKAVRQSRDYTEVIFNRAIINGIELLKEQAEKLAVRNIKEEEKKFDKRKVIGE